MEEHQDIQAKHVEL